MTSARHEWPQLLEFYNSEMYRKEVSAMRKPTGDPVREVVLRRTVKNKKKKRRNYGDN